MNTFEKFIELYQPDSKYKVEKAVGFLWYHCRASDEKSTDIPTILEYYKAAESELPTLEEVEKSFQNKRNRVIPASEPHRFRISQQFEKIFKDRYEKLVFDSGLLLFVVHKTPDGSYFHEIEKTIEKTIEAIFAQAGQLRKAHLDLNGLFQQIHGDVCVCDPYYGKGSLYRLDLLVKHCKIIRFLTQKADKREISFIDKAIKDFMTENPNVKFRKASSHELHDRYILTDQEIIILGHGLKDIGTKNSFVIRLSKDLCGNLIDSVRVSFDNEWNQATSLI